METEYGRVFSLEFNTLSHLLFSGHSHQCSNNYAEKELKRVKDTCQLIEKGTNQLWFEIKCPFPPRRLCVLMWCRDLAFCLKQSAQWQEKCIQKLNRENFSATVMMNSVGNSLSYSLDVKHCYHYLGLRFYKVYTMIKIRLFNGISEGDSMYKIYFVVIMNLFIISSTVCA